MELVRKSISKWIISVVVLVVGILCIVAGAASGEAQTDAYTGISMTIGITLIVIASLSLLFTLIASILSKGEAQFIALGTGAAMTLATGIFFVVDKGWGSNLIWILLNYIPFVLLTVGAVIVVDGILVIVFGAMKKNTKSAIYTAVVEFAFAAIIIVLGALMVGNDPVISKNAQIITFGAILIIYSLLICASTLLVKTYKETTHDSIDAEVTEVNNEEKNAD